MQELADADKARAGRQHSFTFLQAGEQLWQPAFLTSIDHLPSQHTPKLGVSSNAGSTQPPQQQPQPQPQPQEQHKQRLTTLEEDTPTPFSEVCPVS